MDIKRVLVIVLDGVGAGEAQDAAVYGDCGSNSLSNTAKAVGGLRLPNLEALGFGYITPMLGVAAVPQPGGAYGRMQPVSAGKDSITGHWELMGVYLEHAFPTYPNGFPSEVLNEIKRRSGYDVLGNKAASGTDILIELGEEHMRTGIPIVYTSADSVFQVAAHEEIFSIERLYELCETSRQILHGEHGVGRVIARPFTGGSAATFQRTTRRRDYPLAPIADTVMDKLLKQGRQVRATGKIDDLFGGRGISHTNHTTNNEASTLAMLEYLEVEFEGLLFTNLIEFDMIYGHRNDPPGYAGALEAFDRHVPEILRRLRPTDMAIIAADHGVDPTTISTDHSRELSPLLVFGPPVTGGVDLGTRGSYSDVAATIAEVFSLEPPAVGKSFLREVTQGS
ncbi:MAG TPA: phosphopentomutase [Levilinea sp.]|nr:phosphopentomutase [Levilinea sp.]